MSTKQKTEAKAKQTNVALKMNLRVTEKDFSEALTVTRTLHFDVVSKTSIVESTLACAAATNSTFTCSTLANFIVNNLKVKDCFHKREQNKAKDVHKSTVLRVRHHVKDTIKSNHIADTLYSYDSKTDSVTFSEKYIQICTEDLTYRKKVSALIKRVKAQYSSITKKSAKKSVSDKTDTAVSKKAKTAKNDSKKAVNA